MSLPCTISAIARYWSRSPF